MLAKSNMNALRKLGYSSYEEYRRSEHWKSKIREHRAQGLPQCCIACGTEAAELRHRTYTRLGKEQLFDLIPLCDDCNTKVEDLALKRQLPPQAIHKVLRELFHWTREEARKRFEPFGGFAWVDHSATRDGA